MTPEELLKDQALFELCMKEAEQKVRAGMDPEQAKLEVFKAHGIQFDEDAAKAKLVGKMELSDEELRNVSGGGSYNCAAVDSCYYVALHHFSDNEEDACLWNYNCLAVHNDCDASAHQKING